MVFLVQPTKDLHLRAQARTSARLNCLILTQSLVGVRRFRQLADSATSGSIRAHSTPRAPSSRCVWHACGRPDPLLRALSDTARAVVRAVDGAQLLVAQHLGLACMCFATLLPLGIVQLYESVSHDYLEARSLQYLTSSTNALIEWLRLLGDVLDLLRKAWQGIAR